MEHGTCKSILPKELEIEPFIDDQDSGVTDDDVKDQEDMDRYGGNKKYSAWAKYGRYHYPRKLAELMLAIFLIAFIKN